MEADDLIVKYKPLLEKQLEVFLNLIREENSKENGWSLMKETNGATMMKKRFGDSGFDLIKAVGEIPVPVETAWPFILDLSNRQEADKTGMTKSCDVLDAFPEHHMQIAYTRVNPLLVISSRDFLNSAMDVELNDDKKGHVLILVEIDNDDYDVAEALRRLKERGDDVELQEKPYGVRGKLLICGIHLAEKMDDPSSSILTYVAASDPQGWIPRRVINVTLAKNAEFVHNIRDYITSKVTSEK